MKRGNIELIAILGFSVILLFGILLVVASSHAGMNGGSNVSISILGSVAIIVDPSEMDFGDLQVKAGFTGANCSAGWELGTGPWNNSGCDVYPDIQPINVENIGNVNVILEVNGTKNATDFFSPYANTPVTTPAFTINVTGDINNLACSDLPANKIELNTSLQRLCGNFTAMPPDNMLEVAFIVTVPVESIAGQRNNTLSFFATEL